MTTRVRRLALWLVLAGCVGLVWASTASASSIYTRGSATTQQYVYANETNTGEMSVVVVREAGGNYHFEEAGPGTAMTYVDPRCTLVSPTEATCPIVDNLGDLYTVDAELHDATDSIDMRTTRTARIEGGAGSDVLKGGSSGDIILGDGDNGSHGADGNDFIDGRGGADNMLGDAGSDTVSYASRSTAVTVSVDDVANDGGFGEGDNVRSDVEIVQGTSAGDTMRGNNAANRFIGLAGFDDLVGLGGPDTLEGGDTIDSLDGGGGNDSLVGGGGADTLRAGVGFDSLAGGDDDDALLGGADGDDMSGGPGGADAVDYAGVPVTVTVTANDDAANDGHLGEFDNVHRDVERIFGGSGDDTLEPVDLGGEVWGRGGDDTLLGHNSNDRLEGGPGDDTLDGRFGGDVMNGDGGIDIVDYSDHWFDDGFGGLFGVGVRPNGVADDGNGFIDSGGAGTFDDVAGDVEVVIGTPAPDVLQGSAIANRLVGGAEVDDLAGGPGDDELVGGAGADTLDGGLGADGMDGGPDTDTATYASRNAPVRVTLNDVANDGDIATNEGDNVMTTVENVRGGSDADVLNGGGANNRLIGGGGDDGLNGGDGADVLDGQQGVDTIFYTARTEAVAVTLDGIRNDGSDPNGNGTSTAAEEGDLDLAIENVNGGSGNDILRAPVADAVSNVLRGFDGDDTLNAREGTATVDTLACGNGAADRVAADPADAQSGCEVSLP